MICVEKENQKGFLKSNYLIYEQQDVFDISGL